MQTLSKSLCQAYFAKDYMWLSAVISVAAWGEKKNLGCISVSSVFARNSILTWSGKISSGIGQVSLLLINEDVLVIISKSTRKHCLIFSLYFSLFIYFIILWGFFSVYFLEIHSILAFGVCWDSCPSLICARFYYEQSILDAYSWTTRNPLYVVCYSL